MNRKLCTIVFVTLLVLLVSGVAAAGAPEAGPVAGAGRAISHGPIRGGSSTAAARIEAATTITITSTADDAADGYSKTCLNASPCTLRRAINQAYSLGSGDRPAYIIFDIPTSDPGYNASLEVWKITLTGTSGQPLRGLFGQTALDGSTQPGGRTTGPKIIIDGDEHKNYGLPIQNSDNVVRGLAMQNFLEGHISLSGSSNTIEDCWFGLSDDGTTLSSGDPENTEGGSGIASSAGANGNTIRNNVMAGFFQPAASVRGSKNVFSGNWIGTRADGTVPLPPGFERHPCLAGAWEGGVGITVEGTDNQIGGPTAADGNMFVGLYLNTTMQSPVMDVVGSGHTIQNNVIGLDVHGDPIGVCGTALDFGGGPDDMHVLDNTLVETAIAIFMNSSVNGNTLGSNIIWWTADGPANGAISYGATVPSALVNFMPARVTSINGTAVSGVSGAGNTCDGCTIELFLDDMDGVVEALQSLAVVTATGSGNWTATLPAPLAQGYGIRTMSTVPDDFTITGLSEGTTSNLSDLYANFLVFLPRVEK